MNTARHLIILILFFAGSLAAPSAQAFVDPPTFSPAAPNSNQQIAVSVRHGVCHAFPIATQDSPPRRIEFSPGFVDIYDPGIIAFDGFCINPIATATYTLAPLPPGSFQVRIWIIDASFNFQQTTQVTSAPLFISQGAPPQAIPSLGNWGLMLLIALVIFVAFFARMRLNLRQG